MIKSLRKLAGGERRRSAPRSEKSDIAITAPKRIVRALYPYTARSDDELSFAPNEFLYVVDESDPEWYLACDPLKNASGLVPVSYFEVIQRQEAAQALSLNQAINKQVLSGHSPSPSLEGANRTTSLGTHSISHSVSSARLPVNAQTHSRGPSAVSHAGSSRRSKKSSSTNIALYGFVLYDFHAERSDELEASAGESIVVIAQSNEEWFVAKPIGRLGGPGLIPVSYVELREVGTDLPVDDVQEAVRRAGIPHVEEWKRRAAEYKASSIPLGKFETTPSASNPVTSPAPNSHSQPHMRSQSQAQPPGQGYTQNNIQGQSHDNNPQSSRGEPGYVVEASVDRFAINGGRYWYLVKAQMSDGKYRNLCRFYQDFYDFQIRLLEEFPAEAGRTGQTRTLPFMPGPLTLVNHTISSQRRASLDDYVRDLIRMPPHISRSPVVLQLFELRDGDVESDVHSATLPQPPAADATANGNGHTEGEYFGDMSEQLSAIAPAAQPMNSTTSDAGSSGGAQPQLANRQVSQPAASVKEGTVKVKVYSKDDVIAIRVAASLPFIDVYRRLATRLNMEQPELYTSSTFEGDVIDSQEAYEQVVAGGQKVAFYAKP